ncbi:hypothetical protein [Streptomyces caniscabiei]|uniref:CHAT domain-containing protein n=1 Tax=Streptomyces caniscabiei TaxID=2746961 RepID=A0ABU4N4S6_9ACTN|nr:hypothetical protein [Streptomyces caniscabiei]MBE4740502.1 hypothetical protein [Streptomyces caniscabiei]MBE4761313.1 hypothetical protein [Streptomyces caniscabiei]MBE4773464.1 hypothetical protein [Streptomyces caniscabiei]MBE4790089.1 hypothetical protein [Streptomyces caniscabiei]MBE4799323.1 hypothetical protein [Streptomyces caniscabiei]
MDGLNDDLGSLVRSLEAARPWIARAAGEQWPELVERLDWLLAQVSGENPPVEDFQLLRLGYLMARDPLTRALFPEVVDPYLRDAGPEILLHRMAADTGFVRWPGDLERLAERLEPLLELLRERVRGEPYPVEEFQLLRLGRLIASDPDSRAIAGEANYRLSEPVAIGQLEGNLQAHFQVGPRFVNLAIERRGDLPPVPRGIPLEPASDHFVRVDIGDVSADSIVTGPRESPFPLEALPHTAEGYWLEVALTSADFDVRAETVPYFLPFSGAGWVCPCPPGGLHECRPDFRHRHTYLPFRTPDTAGAAQARLSIWFRNSLVQSLLIVADIAPAGMSGDHAATVDYTLTDALTDLDGVGSRGLSILTNQRPDGTHSLVFNGGTGEVAFTLAEAALTGEMSSVRQLLLDMHIEGSGKKRRNRLDKRNGKTREDFLEDLRGLALHGYRLWVSLYQQRPEILCNVTGKPSTTIQIARVPSTTFVFPWAAVYDLPLDSYPGAPLKPCPVVESWDDTQPMIADYPLQCPEESAHQEKNTLCPFGFWGIRHVIENPPSTQTPSRQVVLGDHPRFVVVRSHDLDRDLGDRHINEVAQTLPGFARVTAESLNQACAALTDSDLQVVEFYCHGKGNSARHWLEVGSGEQIHPEQITTWSLVDWAPPNGPDRHWETTTPVVLLNGCHTVELTPQSPVNFVDTFVSAHASGVIGTEITLHQSLAGEAAEHMLRHFGGGRVGMGEVVRRMRHDLLAKGNLLGLTYTAYCSAELRLAR